MITNSKGWTVACAVGAAVVGLLIATNPDALFMDGSLVSKAEAIVGMPLTPISVAGVARRTTRRTIALSSIYVASLPKTTPCVQTTINGTLLYQCGGTYYQPYGTQYVVVYVN